MQKTIELKLELDDNFVEDVLATAMYQGIAYWCSDVELYNKEDGTIEELKEGWVSKFTNEEFSLRMQDAEDEGTFYHMNIKSFWKGYSTYLSWAIEKGMRPYSDTCMIDAEVADIIVQFGVFGEIIYG